MLSGVCDDYPALGYQTMHPLNVQALQLITVTPSSEPLQEFLRRAVVVLPLC